MSVNWDTLRELAGFRADSGSAISFYVNLDPQLTPTTADLQTRTSALLDEAHRRSEASRARRTHEQHAAVRSDLERIREYFESEFSREGAHGAVVFAASFDGYWRPMALSGTVPDAVRLNCEFYLTPLVPLVGRGGGALVAFVGRERGDLYELRDGRLEAIAARFDEQPRRHDQGGWSQANFQRHADNLAHGHLRGLAEELERRFRSRRPVQVVIAGAEDTRTEFAALLSSEVRPALVGWTNAEAHATPSDLLSLVRPVLERARVELEAEAVTRWHDEIGRNSRAAAGWGSTIEAAANGRIALLLYEQGANHPAWRCPACGWLQLEGGACPLDGTELERHEEGLDLVLHQTLVRGGTAHQVIGRPDLDPAGGIGALLRY